MQKHGMSSRAMSDHTRCCCAGPHLGQIARPHPQAHRPHQQSRRRALRQSTACLLSATPHPAPLQVLHLRCEHLCPLRWHMSLHACSTCSQGVLLSQRIASRPHRHAGHHCAILCTAMTDFCALAITDFCASLLLSRHAAQVPAIPEPACKGQPTTANVSFCDACSC